MDNNKPDCHPSYGTVGFYRMYGNKPTALFGSSIPHSQTIQLVVHRAKTERKLCQDFISPTDEILRLEISYTQFAELLTNLNNGTGIPCTLRYTETDGSIPPCPFTNKYETLQQEFQENLDKTNETAEQLYQEVQTLFDSKASISKTDRKEILNKLHKIVTMSKQNEAFILKQFQRQTERTILEAKQEFEAFAQQKLLDLQLSDKDVPITGLLPEVTQSTEK